MADQKQLPALDPTIYEKLKSQLLSTENIAKNASATNDALEEIVRLELKNGNHAPKLAELLSTIIRSFKLESERISLVLELLGDQSAAVLAHAEYLLGLPSRINEIINNSNHNAEVDRARLSALEKAIGLTQQK